MKKNNIVECKDKKSIKPRSINEIGVDRFLNRKIIKWSSTLGTYGMGGPGFFGIKLERTKDYNEEWFVLRLWNASEWLLLDGEWVAANPIFYAIKKPLLSDFAKVFVKEGPWDNLTDKLIDFKITKIVISNNSSCLELQNSNKKHVLEMWVEN